MWIKLCKDVFESADFNGLTYIIQLLSWYPQSKARYNIFVDKEDIKKSENFKNLMSYFPIVIDLFERKRPSNYILCHR